VRFVSIAADCTIIKGYHFTVYRVNSNDSFICFWFCTIRYECERRQAGKILH